MVYFPGPLILLYIGPFEILSWKNVNRSLEQISCGCHIPLEKGVGLSTVAFCFHTYSFSVVSVSLSFSLLIFRKTRVFFCPNGYIYSQSYLYIIPRILNTPLFWYCVLGSLSRSIFYIACNSSSSLLFPPASD